MPLADFKAKAHLHVAFNPNFVSNVTIVEDRENIASESDSILFLSCKILFLNFLKRLNSWKPPSREAFVPFFRLADE
jgi:hypothetical protein